MNVRIEPSWKKVLAEEFKQPYFKKLAGFVKKEYTNHTVYPPPKFIFHAFKLTPFDRVKVVILGQDPYHGPRQANGLCFSVTPPVKSPPSLLNIYKEIRTDIGRVKDTTGDLTHWANQGVLLLNATLTVCAGHPTSHQNQGWERFTDAVIRTLSEKKEGLVFMLWGRYAQEKGAHIDRPKHLVLTATHPSPYSADHGFFGCHHFSQANTYLVLNGQKPIDW